MNMEGILIDVAMLGAVAFMVAFFYIKIKEMLDRAKRPASVARKA